MSSSPDNTRATGSSPRAQEERVPYTTVHGAIRRLVESTQDVIAALLALVLFGAMVRALWVMVQHVLAPTLSFRVVIAEALFILVLIELQRLLIIYLRDHHVSVDVMVEIALVAALREVSLRGIVEVEALQLLAMTLFVIALGGLLRYGDLRAGEGRRARGARNSIAT